MSLGGFDTAVDGLLNPLVAAGGLLDPPAAADRYLNLSPVMALP
jgi:hypothetical protein